MQKFWSILFGATMLGSLLLFVFAPLANWWLPKNVATFGGKIDNLFYLILAITGFFFVLTEGILVYALWQYAGRSGHKSDYVHGNHKLEITWTVVPGVVLLLLAIVQINVWAEVKYQKNMPKPNGETQQMEVLAKQWEWRVRYPSPRRMAEWEKSPALAQDFGQNPHMDDLHLPNEIHTWKGVPGKDHKVLVHLKTQDVIHSFFLPNLRLKQDALPGKTIPVWFAVTESNTMALADATGKKVRWIEKGFNPATGKYTELDNIWELACAEFCGVRHSMMRGKLYVHDDKADYLDWLQAAYDAQNSHQAPRQPTPVAAR